jgi:hypothetical protein
MNLNDLAWMFFYLGCLAFVAFVAVGVMILRDNKKQ